VKLIMMKHIVELFSLFQENLGQESLKFPCLSVRLLIFSCVCQRESQIPHGRIGVKYEPFFLAYVLNSQYY